MFNTKMADPTLQIPAAGTAASSRRRRPGIWDRESVCRHESVLSRQDSLQGRLTLGEI